MPRPARTLEEGRLYHVFNRVGGDSRPFSDEYLAKRFVWLLRRVVERDDLLIYAWVLMSNHYHLVVRMGAVPLSRSMKTLQQETTRSWNRTSERVGALWQGRFKAKWVEDERYLAQLIAYVHLNPVTAGLADSARAYPWSGHREVVGLRTPSIIAVENLLVVYGQRRSEALAAYRSALSDARRSPWIAGSPGGLPWWRLGRPPADDELAPGPASSVDQLGRPTSPYRPRFDAESWLEAACPALHVSRDELSARDRHSEIVRVREILAVVGVERYGVRVKDLAAALGKSEDGVSLWVRRGARRRRDDPSFAAEVEALDGLMREAR